MKPFFSLLDSRTKIKGSRDPLGFQVIWSNAGRELIPNLTTITSNINNCIQMLLCCHYAYSGENKNAKLKDIQDRFMKMEQLLGYVRLYLKEKGISADEALTEILGITKVRSNYEKNAMFLGSTQEALILSNQLTYGLWGYYTSALASAGLISFKNGSRELTEDGFKIIERLLGTEAWKTCVDLCDSKVQIRKSELPHQNTLFSDIDVREKLARKLLGSYSGSSVIFKFTSNYLKQSEAENVTRSVFLNALKESEELKDKAEKIANLDAILKVVNWVFETLRSSNNQSIIDITRAWERFNSEQSLPTDLETDPSNLPDSFPKNLIELPALINQKKYELLCESILRHHKEIMTARNGGSWIILSNGIVKVISKPEQSRPIYKRHGLEYPYFINSYLSIFKQAFLHG